MDTSKSLSEFLAETLGLEDGVIVDVDPAVLDTLLSVTFGIQTVLEADGLYYRLINRNGFAIALRRGFLSDSVQEISLDLAEKCGVNFNANPCFVVEMAEERVIH